MEVGFLGQNRFTKGTYLSDQTWFLNNLVIETLIQSIFRFLDFLQQKLAMFTFYVPLKIRNLRLQVLQFCSKQLIRCKDMLLQICFYIGTLVLIQQVRENALPVDVVKRDSRIAFLFKCPANMQVLSIGDGLK